jgi:hypothetical protein
MIPVCMEFMHVLLQRPVRACAIDGHISFWPIEDRKHTSLPMTDHRPRVNVFCNDIVLRHSNLATAKGRLRVPCGIGPGWPKFRTLKQLHPNALKMQLNAKRRHRHEFCAPFGNLFDKGSTRVSRIDKSQPLETNDGVDFLEQPM